MKIITFLLSLYSVITNKINIECVYEELSQIEYIYDEYKVLEREDDIEILYKDERIDLLNCKYNYKILYKDEILIVFYKFSNNDYLNIKKYSKGKNIITKTINNKFVNTFDVLQYKTNYIFVSSITDYENEEILSLKQEKDYLLKRDAVIIVFDEKLEIINFNLLGGVLNDYFSKIYIDEYDESLYIVGAKEQNTGYDFGYGGNGVSGYLLVNIDHNLQITNYLVFDEPIKNLEFKENIYIYTLNYIYMFDYDLNIISSLKLASECVFGYEMSNNCIAIFSQNNLKIYDYNKNIVLDTYNFDNFNGVDLVEIKENYVYLRVRDTIYKAVFYDSFLENKKFIYDTNEMNYYDFKTIGIPKDYELKEIHYEEGYNRSVFGVYKMILDYEFFNIYCEIEILPRCNIVSDYIYPVGYNIKFSGTAYLNGNPIDNNYPLNEEGSYELKLVGKKEQLIYNFDVYNFDIKYKDTDLKIWDYEIYKNQTLTYEMNYNGEYNIKTVIVNNNEQDFEVDKENKKVILYFSENEIGFYNYFIDKIIYEYDNKEYYEKINDLLTIKVLEDKISLDNNFYNNEKEFIFSINILDNHNLRFIKIMSSNNQEQDIYIPIKEGPINISNYNINSKDIFSFYLLYDVGGKLYQEQLLFKLEYDLFEVKELGSLEIKFIDEMIQEIIFKFNNDEKLKKVIIDEEVKFENNTAKDYTLVCVSIIIVLVLFGIAKTMKSINKKRNKAKTK